MILLTKIVDHYECTKDRILLTQNEHHIPGLQTLGHNITGNASEPMEWHRHENCFEFTLPTKGELCFSTETCDYPFSAGNVFISKPGEIHSTNFHPVAPGEFYWFQIDASDTQSLLFLSPFASQELIQKLYNITPHVINLEIKKSSPAIKLAFDYALKGDNPLYVASLIHIILHLCINSSCNQENSISPDILNALNYIQAHITDELTLEQLASISNLSCSQFKQKFKYQTGLSPLYYINQQKIEFSKELLLEGKSVTDIAMLLNFTSSSYFATVFKKYTLFTPSEYKQNIFSRENL